MKYLITGGAGFIGSHLAEELLNRGHEVTVFDNLSTGKLSNIAHLLEKFKKFNFKEGDITDTVIRPLPCDIIFHLAASVGVKLIVDNPLESIQNNISGMEHILRLANAPIKVIFTSTSEVYGKGEAPFKEDDNLILGAATCNRWSYAASKIVDEFLCLAYYEKGLPVVIARLFNIVGARQSGDYGMVLPRFVQSACDRNLIQIYGDGRQTRCFLHVLDVVEALILLSESEEAIGEIVNVGSNDEITIEWLAKEVIKIVGKDEAKEMVVNITFEEAYCKGFEDMARRVPDISKLKKLTKWTQKHSLEEAIEDVKREISCCNSSLSA